MRVCVNPMADLAGAIVGRVLRHGLSPLRNIPPLVEAMRDTGAEPHRAEMFAGCPGGCRLLGVHGAKCGLLVDGDKMGKKQKARE